MNERMAELFGQAGISDSINEEFGIEYLAELIVKECMAQCERVAVNADAISKSKFITDEGRQLHGGMWGGAKNCAMIIKQHFGVKE